MKNSRLDSPTVSAGIVASAYSFFLLLRFVTHTGDPSAFVLAGEQFSHPGLVAKNLRVLPNTPGYDGQFYYRLALNPFTTKRTEFGVTLDNPPYRHQRIVYPFIVWVVSLGGRADLVPAMMIVTNYVALCAMGWIGGLYARSMGQHALWGTLFPFYAGFLLTLSFDLTEIVAVCFLLTGLYFTRRAHLGYATLFLTLAVLTRETTLIVAGSAFLLWLAGKTKGGPHGDGSLTWPLFLIPGVFYGMWQATLLYYWGQIPLFSAQLLGLPLVGFLRLFADSAALTTRLQVRILIELIFILALTLATSRGLSSSRASAHEKLSWILYALMVSLLGSTIWVREEDWSFMRALSEFYVLGMVIMIGSQSPFKVPIAGGALVLWLVVFRSRVLGV